MFKKLLPGFIIIALACSVATPRAEAVSLSEALQRMDEIIKEMEALRVEFSKLSSTVGQGTPTPSVLGASSKKVFTQSLDYGETNDDIRRIQELFSTDPEIYDHPYVTGFFGPVTEDAVRKFQTRFGLEPVGVIGPATTALLELFMNAYPDENYPVDVLKKKPQVQGVSTSNGDSTGTPVVSASNPALSIEVEFDRGEAEAKIVYKNGNRRTLFMIADSNDEVVKGIAGRTTLTETQIREVISFDGDSSSGDSSSNDADEQDAEDAIDDADEAIEDAEDEIEEADEDGEDVDWAEDTLDEAKDLLDDAEEALDDGDYDEAVELAEEAEDLAKEAEDRIGEEDNGAKGEKGDSDDIDSIEVEVDEGESKVVVEYDDGKEYEFSVEEDRKDEIIEEIADELDMDEDDVEDLIEFDFGELDEIVVTKHNDDEALVSVTYKSGVDLHFRIDIDDEDEMIEEIADEIDSSESDVEDVVDFDL